MYQKLMEMKEELRALRMELDTLKTAEPTADNLARVNEITARAKGITLFIRQKSQVLGVKA